ncbi:hypothetical protein GCM10010421_09810 [Streptomyces glaucus]|uniref:Uncharacterized protein n=1 Tax=Streptomyces glaucus TaxID=284029 RepID=A0ABN3J9N0_9ACTN
MIVWLNGPFGERRDGAGQALESVADEHAHVLDAPVPDPGQGLEPVLGAFAAAGPRTGNLARAVHRDRQGDVDRPVRHLPVAHLHVHAVDEDHRMDRVQRPVLPLGHLVHDLVGGGRRGLLGHARAVDPGQAGGDVTVRQTTRGQRQDHGGLWDV